MTTSSSFGESGEFISALTDRPPVRQRRGQHGVIDMRGIISIVIGLVMIVGGLSGKLVLIGTHSGMALAGLGVVVILLGVMRMARGT